MHLVEQACGGRHNERMHGLLVTLTVLGVIAAVVVGLWLLPRAVILAVVIIAVPVMACVAVLRRSRPGRLVLEVLLRAGYLLPWIFGLCVAGCALATLGIMAGLVFSGLAARPLTTLEHAGELVFWLLVLPALTLLTFGIGSALKRAAAMNAERARRVRGGLGGGIAFTIYGVAGGAETATLGLSVNGYFRGHLFDAVTLAALVTFGWLLVPADQQERPPGRARLRAYGYFAVACGGIAGLGGYTAGGGLGDVAAWALMGALAGWLLALGMIASLWQQRPADPAEEIVDVRFKFSVARSPGEIFDLVSDPTGHPAWVGGLTRVTPGPGPLAAGATGREVWRILGRPFTVGYEITTWEPGRRWCCRARSRYLDFERRIDLPLALSAGPGMPPGAADGSAASVDVQLRLIGKGAWGPALKMFLGQPWTVLGLGDQDRLRSLLGVPSRAEEGSYARVSWDWPGEVLGKVVKPPSFRLRRRTRLRS